MDGGAAVLGSRCLMRCWVLETDSSLFYWEPFGEKAHAGPRRGGVGGREGGLRAAWPRLLLKPRVGVRASVSDSYSMNHETGHRTRLQQEQQGSISAQKLLPQNSFPEYKVCPPHYCYPRLLFKSTLFVSLAFYHLPQLACFLNYFSSYYTL